MSCYMPPSFVQSVVVPVLESAEDTVAGLRAAAVGRVLHAEKYARPHRQHRQRPVLMVDKGVGEMVVQGMDIYPMEENWGVGKVYVQRPEVADGETDRNPEDDLSPQEMLEKLKWEARVDLFKTTFLAVAGLWAVSMASFLQIFVPQKCGALPEGYVSPWFGKFPSDFYTQDHSCSLTENVDWPNAPPLKRGSLVMNMTTAVLNVGSYLWLANRERWIKDHFVRNKALDKGNLAIDLKSYPRLMDRLDEINARAYNLALFNLLNVAANFGFSGYVLIEYYYEGPRTVIELVTFTMLIMPQLMNALSIAYESSQGRMAMSLFEKDAVSLNQLQAKYQEGKYYDEDADKLDIDNADIRRGVMDAARRHFKSNVIGSPGQEAGRIPGTPMDPGGRSGPTSRSVGV